MPDVVKLAAPAVYPAEGQRVFLRETFGDSWEEVPGLYCNFCTWCCAPSVSSAEFEWRYGRGKTAAEQTFGFQSFKHYGDWWIKVEIEQPDDDWKLPADSADPAEPLTWIGIVKVSGDNPAGSAEEKPMGGQKLLAYGPEMLLERAALQTTIAWAFNEGGAEQATIYRAIPFNEDAKVRAADRLAKKEFKSRPGNRSNIRDEAGFYIFADPQEGDTSGFASWTAKEIIQYLLAYQTPRDKDAVRRIEFALSAEDDGYIPTGKAHEVRQEGRSVRDVLDQLLDRRRLLGYCVEASDAEQLKFTLRPFTFMDADIDLDELTVEQNLNAISLEVDESILTDAIAKQESWLQSYDRVVALGAPIVVCGTFSYASSLEAKWNATEAYDYKNAALATAGYGALEPYEKEQRVQAIRAEERFQAVYSAFGLSNRNFTNCGDGFAGGAIVEFFAIEIFGDARNCRAPFYREEKFFYPALKLLNVLPLRSDHDYSGSKIADDTIGDDTPDGQNWKYVAPLVILNLKNPDKTANYFCDLAKSGALAACETMGYGAGVEFSASVQIPEKSAYFQLKFHACPQHVLAWTDYSSPAALGYPEQPPIYNWKTDLLATLAVEADCRVQKQWPASIDGDPDFVKTLYIDLSDYAALHYVAPKTVVAVKDGALVRTDSGGYIRDDRPLLEKTARLAYEWYSRRRQAVTLSYRGAKKFFNVGDLITEMGVGETWEPIRTVVTDIRLDLGRTAKDFHRTTIQTQWAELDVLRLLT